MLFVCELLALIENGEFLGKNIIKSFMDDDGYANILLDDGSEYICIPTNEYKHMVE